jgi:hypothetical protein
MRWIGIFPLLFFIIKFFECYKRNALFDLLWFCNITNFLLGISILFQIQFFIWLFTICIYSGIAPWIFGLFIGVSFEYSSLLTHLISPILGTYVLIQMGAKFKIWYYGILYLLILQILSRFFTPFQENVNIAFFVYPELLPVFHNYPIYWFSNMIGLGISLCMYERLLIRLK